MGSHGGTRRWQSPAHRNHGDPQLSADRATRAPSEREPINREPSERDPQFDWRPLLGALIGVAAIALGARLSIAMPATPVPQSAQTLAVLLVGGLLGPRWGPCSVLLYIAAGVSGLPVFADGASGPGVLMGPTAGYLFGFVIAAWGMGWCRGRVRRYSGWLFAGVLAHLAVLACGWVRLAFGLGGAGALEAGVSPFLMGGLWKSMGTAMVLAARNRAVRFVGAARRGG